jgi:hypothetical protein
MNNCGHSVTVARLASSREEWFNSTSPLQILDSFPPHQAMEFRKRYVKGFIRPGSCNHYIGVSSGNLLFGMLGFTDYSGWSNSNNVDADIQMRADTTPSEYIGATELLLYVLRTREVKQALERKFNREINTIYSMCFSSHPVISRYRKHGELITKIPIRTNKQTADEKLKQKANYKVRTELKAGRLIKQPCEVCGITEYVEAHHRNYFNPLDINWLCIEHHNERDGTDETCYKIEGYNLGYLFRAGSIVSLKEAKARFMQKWKN